MDLDEITKKHVDDLSFDAIFNPASTETRPIKNIVDSSQIFQEVNKRQPTETKECRMAYHLDTEGDGCCKSGNTGKKRKLSSMQARLQQNMDADGEERNAENRSNNPVVPNNGSEGKNENPEQDQAPVDPESNEPGVRAAAGGGGGGGDDDDDPDPEEDLKALLDELVQMQFDMEHMQPIARRLRNQNRKGALFYGSTGVSMLVNSFFKRQIERNKLNAFVVKNTASAIKERLDAFFVEVVNSAPALYIIIGIEEANETIANALFEQFESIQRGGYAVTFIATATEAGGIQERLRQKFEKFYVPAEPDLVPDDSSDGDEEEGDDETADKFFNI